ncbi:MAG: hypothetical protein OXC37_06475 [Bdellovibrionaceae bacterium]|nr:hypothetical protein [Pseudobdellovibrionaceae bacterium]
MIVFNKIFIFLFLFTSINYSYSQKDNNNKPFLKRTIVNKFNKIFKKEPFVNIKQFINEERKRFSNYLKKINENEKLINEEIKKANEHLKKLDNEKFKLDNSYFKKLNKNRKLINEQIKKTKDYLEKLNTNQKLINKETKKANAYLKKLDKKSKLIDSILQSGCDFSPFSSIEWNCIGLGFSQLCSVKAHARKKQTFFVSNELIDIAKKANEILSDSIGLRLFEIKQLKEYKGKGGKIYISTSKSHFESMKKIHEKAKNNIYSAYNKVQNYDHYTGEIYKSDIVFNPLVYNQDNRDKDKLKQLKKITEEIQIKNQNNYALLKKSCKTENLNIRVKYKHTILYKNNRYDCSNIQSLKKRMLKEEREIKKYYDIKAEEIYKRPLKTMLHEMGHALGLKHTHKNKENLMHPSANKLILTSQQINAIRCAFSLNSPIKN